MNYCLSVLERGKCENLPFHNSQHTKDVVANVIVIGKELSMDTLELEPVILAAWFHDIGFSESYKAHEDSSMILANEFLVSSQYNANKLKTVLACIEATKLPQNPKETYAKILCDSDVFHISNSSFFYRNLLLRREWEIFLNKKYTDKEWILLNLEFLQHTHFFTVFGKDVLDEGKKNNVEKLKNILTSYE